MTRPSRRIWIGPTRTLSTPEYVVSSIRTTPSTPGTHRLTAGMSIMKAHTRSGGAGTVMRCSMSTWASVYTDSDATPDWSTPEGLVRRAAADHRRHHAPRRQRADDPRVVRVPRWPDLA